ncbi:LysE family transporter [Shouchella patagoniensis]
MIKKGIINGFNSSLAVGLGGLTADAMFMVCIYFGLSYFLMLSPV